MHRHYRLTREHALTGAALVAVAAAYLPSSPARADQASTPPASTSDAATDNAGSGGLQEIVVTAQHRRENLQDVPISVAAVSAQTLAQAGINSTGDLSQIVPSVQFARSGPSGLFFVRGIGTTNAAPGEEGASAFYVDGVYLPDLAQTMNNFNNIERIEVLKGPQGTLFGRNAFGGLINIITREPGDTFTADGELGYANYNTVSGKLYVAGPIADHLAMDIALTERNQADGWGRNLTLNRDNAFEDYYGARSKMVFTPSALTKITLTGDYMWDKDTTSSGWRQVDGFIGTGGYGSPGGYNTLADHYQFNTMKNWGFSLNGEFNLGFATLTALGAIRDSTVKANLDVEGGPLPILDIDYTSGSRTYQGELRLASTRTEPFSWQGGVFYLHNRSFNDSLFYGSVFGALKDQLINSALTTNSYAAFGEATYSITPTTHVTGGVRYTRDERTLGGTITYATASAKPIVSPTSGKLTYGEFTYRVAIRQEITDRINVYASLNRGFKAGTYNLQSPNLPPVLPEFITAYEVGIKSELFDHRLRLNLTGFHYDISDYQVRSGAGSAIGASVLLNAAKAKVDGIEVEIDAQPIKELRIFGGFTWLDARYGKFGGPGAAYQAPFSYALPAVCDTPATFDRDPGHVTGPPTGGLLTCYGDASGNKLALAPTIAASVGSTLTLPVRKSGTVSLTTSLNYNGGYYFEPDNYFQQKDFVLLNASLEYRPSRNWGIEVWGKNLTDTHWIATLNTTGTGAYTALSAPRTYGVTGKFDF